MTGETSDGFFPHINLKGTNTGAKMTVSGSSSGESTHCCCINIYVNNNIQGVNNSFVQGSEVRMKDPGVFIFLDGVKFDRECLHTKVKNLKKEEIMSVSKRDLLYLLTCILLITMLFYNSI